MKNIVAFMEQLDSCMLISPYCLERVDYVDQSLFLNKQPRESVKEKKRRGDKKRKKGTRGGDMEREREERPERAW